MTYGTEVTRLGTIGHSTEVRGYIRVGVAGDVALTWPELGTMIYGAKRWWHESWLPSSEFNSTLKLS